MKDMQDAVMQDTTLLPDRKSMKTYLPHNRYMVIDYPGVASLRTGNVSIPGNRLISFGHGYVRGLAPEDNAALMTQAGGSNACAELSAEQLFNLYFLHRSNLLITDWKNTDNNISVFITTQLEREQVQDMAEVQDIVSAEMSKRRQAREDAKQEVLDKADAIEAETRRKLELADRAEKQGWENRITELEELNKKLSKDMKALKKAAK